MKFLIKMLTWMQGDDNVTQSLKIIKYSNNIHQQNNQYSSAVKQLIATMDNGMINADKLIVNQDLLTNSSILKILVSKSWRKFISM
ncbi:hypothetical protein [Nostoc sp. MS1]|uniref:hypothetical protein n=1 Tax=Nostoc sp. MS1 TaxID=2764711 RepID=UPI001CC4BF6E|nr:hypothetical protein [Nostoc sp. MS1]BCL39511.1 hypothetical protein NSMS1_59580 [Nostoc sp. MS1]